MAQADSENFALEMIQAHALLDKSLAQLERVTCSPQRRPLDEELLLLRVIAREVQAHFKLEERDGYMATVLKQAPQFTHAAQELLGEHRQLEASLAALIQEASGRPPDEVRAQVSEWVTRIRQHESRENQVVQEAYNRDAAGED
jgi:hypothetical protein